MIIRWPGTTRLSDFSRRSAETDKPNRHHSGNQQTCRPHCNTQHNPPKAVYKNQRSILTKRIQHKYSLQ